MIAIQEFEPATIATCEMVDALDDVEGHRQFRPVRPSEKLAGVERDPDRCLATPPEVVSS